MTNPAKPTFPSTRLRRLRYHPAVRRLVQETHLVPANFVLPLFVRPGQRVRQPIGSMPGHFQISPDQLAAELEDVQRLGLGGVILFGIPGGKGRHRHGFDQRYGHRAAGDRRGQAGRARGAGDHGRLLLRIYGSRPLRR